MTYQQAKDYKKALKAHKRAISEEIDLVEELIEDNEDNEGEDEIGSLPGTPPQQPPRP